MYWMPRNNDSHGLYSFGGLTVIACRQYHSTDSRYCGIITFHTRFLVYWWMVEKLLVKYMRSVCYLAELRTANIITVIYQSVKHATYAPAITVYKVDAISVWIKNGEHYIYIYRIYIYILKQRSTTQKLHCRLRKWCLENLLKISVKSFHQKRMNCI